MTPSNEIHYLTFPSGARLCLGCGGRFDWNVEHDFTVCHQQFIEQATGKFPPHRIFPPDRTYGPEGPREG